MSFNTFVATSPHAAAALAQRSSWLTARSADALAREPAEGERDADFALVTAARAGQREAFARLYERYVPFVHGVVLARARSNDVLDLVHDVFLTALRRLGDLQDVRQFGPWLATIARNLASDAHKRRREVLELVDEPRARASDAHADTEEAERALAALRELPDAYRETLVLRLVEGLSGPEIAERTGLTPGSVRVNLCRGMKLLRERLGLPEA